MPLPSDRSQAKASTGQCVTCGGRSYWIVANQFFCADRCGFYYAQKPVSAGAVS